ncbi:MAG TPA: 30S ribosome-binding factor RbfA [Sedimentisphaerales bacterium]|nr:30S ribosome-binding factor RbfA [Sedimentisphaerales bacterium]
MPTRRQEKVARMVKEVVSYAVTNHLNDPRIQGFVSVTRVEMSRDLRTADVYLSIFTRDPLLQEGGEAASAKTQTEQNKTFAAITHAKSKIQSLLADRLRCKFCPVLRFHTDERFKKTLETMQLIEKAASELKQKDVTEGEQR